MEKPNLKILFATDFSEPSKVALKALISIKKVFDIEVHLIYVMQSFWKNWFSSGLYEKEIRERLATWQQKISGKPNDSNNLVIQEGHVAETISDYANKLEVDLILVGAGNPNKNGQFITGSNVVKLAKIAKQSVLVCKNKTVSNILCGTDSSELSYTAFKQAIEIAKAFNAKLSLVSAIPLPDFNPLGMENEEIEKKYEEFRVNQINEIQKDLKNIDFMGLNIEEHFPTGSPSHILLNMAEDFDIDLIVIGATGQNKWKQMLMGSTAEKILHHSPCSLLIVR